MADRGNTWSTLINAPSSMLAFSGESREFGFHLTILDDIESRVLSNRETDAHDAAPSNNTVQVGLLSLTSKKPRARLFAKNNTTRPRLQDSGGREILGLRAVLTMGILALTKQSRWLAEAIRRNTTEVQCSNRLAGSDHSSAVTVESHCLSSRLWAIVHSAQTQSNEFVPALGRVGWCILRMQRRGEMPLGRQAAVHVHCQCTCR